MGPQQLQKSLDRVVLYALRMLKKYIGPLKDTLHGKEFWLKQFTLLEDMVEYDNSCPATFAEAREFLYDNDSHSRCGVDV